MKDLGSNKPRKKTEEEYEEGFYGLELPANGGAYGTVRRNLMPELERKRALRCDCVARMIAEYTLESARKHYKRTTGKPELPEEGVFEGTYRLPGLPPCKVIVAYLAGEPLTMSKVYPDLRTRKQLVYVFTGDAGPYDVEV